MPRAEEVIHVGFGSHFVAVRSAAPEVTAALREAFGPMLLARPEGTEAGNLEVIPSGGALRISGAPDVESPLAVATGWAAREIYHATIKRLMLARQDLVWVHAGVAALGNRAYLFSGPSGQGKSTLVAALLDRGWTYLSDEVAAIDVGAGLVHPFPLAPRRRVHDGEFVFLDEGDRVRALPKVQVDFPTHAIGRQALPLERIYVLRYLPASSAIEEAQLSPARAVLELLRNSLSISTDRPREIASLAQLAGTVSTVEYRYFGAEAAAENLHARASARPAAA